MRVAILTDIGQIWSVISQNVQCSYGHHWWGRMAEPPIMWCPRLPGNKL